MRVVALQNLKEGAVLSRDVRDINGRLMLSKGQKVDANHIRIFKIWGIPEVYTQAEENADGFITSDKDVEKLAKTEHTVKMLLQNVDTHHPGIEVIYQTAVEHRYKNHLWGNYGASQPLPKNFKLDLSSAIKSQIDFSSMPLPEVPQIITAFTKVANDPTSSSNDIADVVSRSASLSLLLLNLVNSSYYGSVSRIDTIARAVTMVGIKEVSDLVMGIEIMRFFHKIPGDLIDVNTFRRHSLACGLMCRILAAHKGLQHTERLFLSGLLHDAGRLVWYRYFAEQAKMVLYMAQKTGLALYEVEKECLGISHEQIAGYLFRKWRLPFGLENNVVYHHDPISAPNPIEAGIVHMADIAVNALGLGHSGEHIIPHFDSKAWDLAAIAPGTLFTAILQTNEQLDAMEALLAEEWH